MRSFAQRTRPPSFRTPGAPSLDRQPLASQFERWLPSVVDFCLLGVLFVAPLIMGGRGPVGKFAFVIFACCAAIGWCGQQCLREHGRWRHSGVEWLLLAALALLALQLVPLSASALGVASPAIGKYLPLWTSSGMGNWSTISLDPDSTRGALAVFIGYAMLFLILIQRLEAIADIERALRWIAVAVVAMALLGLAQFLFGNGKFGWVFMHPSRDTDGIVKGMFQNQNHFAHFLALGIGPLLWCFWHGAAKESRRLALLKQITAIGLGLVVVAGLLTFSRGGVIAIVTATAVCTGIYYWKSMLDRRSLLGVAAMSIVVLAALCIHGYGPLARRMQTLRDSRSLASLSHGRAALWSAIGDGVGEFPLLGSGVGSHRHVYPMFMEEYYNLEFTHGESGYLPLMLEAGGIGLLLMLFGIAICVYWLLSVIVAVPLAAESSTSRSLLVCAAAVLPGICASIVHSVGDFVWYVTACMSLTVILAACACRLYQLHVAEHQPSTEGSDGEPSQAGLPRLWSLAPAGRISVAPRPVWIAVLAVTAGTAIFVLLDRCGPALAAPAWNAYLRISLADSAGIERSEEAQLEELDTLAFHLQEVLLHNPNDARANLRYAANCLKRFELRQRHGINPMALSQIREAALASQFPSREAQDKWLEVAVGDNKQLLDRALEHARRGLRRSPLQGEGYIYLTNLSFLEGPRREAKQEYIAQAQLVRPHNGAVLFAAGQEAALLGDLNSAVELWRRAFRQDYQMRAVIVESFAPLVPVQSLLAAFEPERDGLALIYYHYQKARQLENARVVAPRYAAALEESARSSDPQASLYWQRAHDVYAFLGLHTKSLICAGHAVELDPSNFQKRRALGEAFHRCGKFTEAVEQFQWCVRRHPDDEQLAQQLAAAKRDGILQRAAARPPSPANPGRR